MGQQPQAARALGKAPGGGDGGRGPGLGLGLEEIMPALGRECQRQGGCQEEVVGRV